MKVEDLVELNLDELEQELDTGSYSKSFLESAMEAEKAGENRKGAIKLFEDAIELAEVEREEALQELAETAQQEIKDGKGKTPEQVIKSLQSDREIYAVAKGKSIGFKAGIKSDGDFIDLDWPELKANPKLLDSLLERGLAVKK